MYITKLDNKGSQKFNWSEYFQNKTDMHDNVPEDVIDIFSKTREHLAEDSVRIGLTLRKMLKTIFKDKLNNAPKILELGAASGFLTRCMLNLFDGSGVLVDKNPEAIKTFERLEFDEKSKINYKIEDVFKYNEEEKYDIVCSFGLIEHFKDKEEILLKHKEHLKENGWMLALIPIDSPLSRSFFEVHPELNLGYRELMSKNEFINILKSNGFRIEDSICSQGYVYDFMAVLCQTE